jgi:hypothetical protein
MSDSKSVSCIIDDVDPRLWGTAGDVALDFLVSGRESAAFRIAHFRTWDDLPDGRRQEHKWPTIRFVCVREGALIGVTAKLL